MAVAGGIRSVVEKAHGKRWRQYDFKGADGTIIKKWTIKMIGQAPGEVVAEQSTERMIA